MPQIGSEANPVTFRKAIVGKGTYPSILEKANASEADMIIAVTRNDEINMLICQIAYSIFNIQKKIWTFENSAHLHNDDNTNKR